MPSAKNSRISHTTLSTDEMTTETRLHEIWFIHKVDWLGKHGSVNKNLKKAMW